MSAITANLNQRCIEMRVSKHFNMQKSVRHSCKKPHTIRIDRMLCNASQNSATSDQDALNEEEQEIQGGAVDATLTSTSYDLPEDDAESRALAVAFAKIAWETKAEDVIVLHVAPLIYWTRYMVFCSVLSKPQLNAVLGKIEKEAEETFGRTIASGGEGKSEWELLDFGDVVVHVMTPQQRDYYDLESFYGAAEEVDLPFEDEANRNTPTWEKSL